MKIGYFAYFIDEDEEYEFIEEDFTAILKQAKVDKIFSDELKSYDTEMRCLSVVMDMVREGDVIYTPEIKTLVNNLEGFQFVERWRQKKGVDIVIIKEGIDTRTEEGRKMISLFQIIADIIEEDRERGMDQIADMILSGDLPMEDETDEDYEDYDDCEEEDQSAFDAMLESLIKVPDPMRADNVVPIQKKKPSAKKKDGKEPEED